jgi:hypothetical protein
VLWLKDECLRVLRVMSEVTRRMDLSEFARMVELNADEVLLCMQDLAKTGHLKKSGGGYGVTDKGKAVLKTQTPVPAGLEFKFYTAVGQPTGASARSLKEFYETVKLIDAASLEFHLFRGDFTNWAESALKNELFAGDLEDAVRSGLKGESLREIIACAIEARYGVAALQ